MHLREFVQTKQALGGNVTLGIVTDKTKQEVEQLFAELWRQVLLFERQFSRFLPGSELSLFNRAAGLKMPVTPEFKALLSKAKELSQQTDGIYNPFILPALQRAGYVKSALIGYENDAQEDFSDRRVVDVQHLKLSDDWASIPHGTALDMGGCGKGYLADQLGQMLRDCNVAGYWLSLGGDVATYGHDEHGEALLVNVQTADDLESVTDWVIECPVKPAAVATSGTFRRKGQAGKHNWHHIIDPRNLKSATTDVRLATVCANTAVEADVLASCAVILGSQKAPAFLKRHNATAMLLQCVDEKGRAFKKRFGSQLKRVSQTALQHA